MADTAKRPEPPPISEQVLREGFLSRTWDRFFRIMWKQLGNAVSDLATKIDKIVGGVVGNFPSIIAGGGLEDSGYGPDDFAPNPHDHKSAAKGGDFPWADFYESDVLRNQAEHEVVTITASYDVLTTDYLILVDASANDITINIGDPTRDLSQKDISLVTGKPRLTYKIVRIDIISDFTVTIVSQTTDILGAITAYEIDGETSQELDIESAIILESDNENWWID